MLKIRYQRFGRKNDPAYRIVVTEKTNGPKSGNYLENLGNYSPKTKTKLIQKERILYWISKGAIPSDTVHNLLIKEGVIEGKTINVLPKKTPVKQTEKTAEEQKNNTKTNINAAEKITNTTPKIDVDDNLEDAKEAPLNGT